MTSRRVIAVAAFGDPTSVSTWSGIPAALVSTLEKMGHEVVLVNAELGWRWDRLGQAALGTKRLLQRPRISARDAFRAAGYDRSMSLVRTAGLRRKAAELARAGAVIQIGTSFSSHLAFGGPVVTYEDMTAVQAVDARYPGWRDLPPGGRRARFVFQRHIYERAHACCFMTNWAASSARSDYAIAASKVHVVGLGASHIVEAQTRDWGTPRYLFIGRDWRRKNGDAVVRAFSTIRKHYPAATLDIVGDAPPVDEPGVTRHGPLSLADANDRAQVTRLLRRATCFVMPSLHEPAGIVYAEAAHAGLPSIGTLRGGTPEIVGRGGRVIDPESFEELVAAMQEFAQPEHARRTGELARQRAQMLTWRVVADKLLSTLPSGSSQHEEPEKR